MALRLMYITNDPNVALIAEEAGVDQIFIDMEYIGKNLRQGGMNTVQLHHTPDDVRMVKNVLSKAEVLVRVNPIHDRTELYSSSQEEIEEVIQSGADSIMLPYFKTIDEVKSFIDMVAGRAETVLLLETPEAADAIESIMDIPGIDRIHIGLNDLSLGYHKSFMFELLADGTVEKLCKAMKEKGLSYGIGGIASLGKGMLPAEHIIAEHYRLGSGAAILSRSFCNTSVIVDRDEINRIFQIGMKEIRDFENDCQEGKIDFEENREVLKNTVEKIVNSKNK